MKTRVSYVLAGAFIIGAIAVLMVNIIKNEGIDTIGRFLPGTIGHWVAEWSNEPTKSSNVLWGSGKHIVGPL